MVARLHFMEGGGHTFSKELYIRQGGEAKTVMRKHTAG